MTDTHNLGAKLSGTLYALAENITLKTIHDKGERLVDANRTRYKAISLSNPCECGLYVGHIITSRNNPRREDEYSDEKYLIETLPARSWQNSWG